MIGGITRRRIPMFGLLGLLGLLAAGTSPARGQGAVAFQPTVSTFPSGVILNVTPVVSADRRYVRMGISPVFTDLTGFDVINVPAAVGGGGNGGLGGFGGLGDGGGLGGGGGAGFPSVGLGPTMTPQGYQIPRFDGPAGFGANPGFMPGTPGPYAFQGGYGTDMVPAPRAASSQRPAAAKSKAKSRRSSKGRTRR